MTERTTRATTRPGGPDTVGDTDRLADTDRLGAYEQRTAKPATALALAFIGVYGVPVLWPDLPAAALTACTVANYAIWAAFACDLAYRVHLAPRRWHYLATHPLEVAVVVLPMLRPLRVLRIFVAGQALLSRGGRLTLVGATHAVAVAAGLLMLISALAVLDAERGDEDANITTFGDALWWACATVTTVGYGDRYPVTGNGRVVAFGLMFVGISLLGVVTATIAGWFVAQTQRAVDTETAELEDRMAAIESHLTARSELLRPLHGPVPTGHGGATGGAVAPGTPGTPAATEAQGTPGTPGAAPGAPPGRGPEVG